MSIFFYHKIFLQTFIISLKTLTACGRWSIVCLTNGLRHVPPAIPIQQDIDVAREGHPPKPPPSTPASAFALRLESAGDGMFSDAMYLLLSLLRQVSGGGGVLFNRLL